MHQKTTVYRMTTEIQSHHQGLSRLVSVLAPIIPVIGISLYFIMYELSVLQGSGINGVIITAENIYFYFVCIGICLLSGYATSLVPASVRELWGSCSVFHAYILIMFVLDKSVNEEVQTNWVYIPTGGLIICIVFYVMLRLSKRLQA